MSQGRDGIQDGDNSVKDGDLGAVQRRCSKCKKLTKGHPGPYGSQCNVELEDNNSEKGNENDNKETEEEERNGKLKAKLKELEEKEKLEKTKAENDELES